MVTSPPDEPRGEGFTRHRRKLNLTLSTATHARLAALAVPFDGNISRTIEALVRAAPLPRPTREERGEDDR